MVGFARARVSLEQFVRSKRLLGGSWVVISGL